MGNWVKFNSKLDEGGLELAKKWLDSDVDAQRKAAENWLLDKVKFLDRFDGELDDKINSLDCKINTLNGMIPEFKETCQVALLQEQHRPPYSLDGDKRELIARLMDITRQSGYVPAALPPILSSSETPPLFVAYPELDEENENRCTDQIPIDEQRRPPEKISIEDLLGIYQPRLQQIIIYERGIRWMVVREGFDEEWLSAVVLIHEIGHWITHQLPQPGVPTWPTDLYVLGDPEVHEGWAQLITWWIADQVDVDGEFRSTFEKLNRKQSPPYHVFEQFKTEPIDKVMASLEKLRLLQWPARLEDWEKAL